MDSHDHETESSRYFDDALQNSRDLSVPANWLANPEPWNPHAMNDGGIASTQLSRVGNIYQTVHDQGSFLEYRSTGLPSECDTYPDSGYVSYHPASADNGSMLEGSFEQSHDLASGLSDFHMNLNLETMPVTGPFDAQSAEREVAATQPDADATARCLECKLSFKTKSEHNKHMLRHTKPHTCPHKGCTRQGKGFASQNDLTRHQMSVHKEKGLGKIFYCRHDQCNTKAPKPWPRADNFRSHLNRVHSITLKADADLTSYTQPRLPHLIVNDLSGVGTNLALTTPGSRGQLSGPHVTAESIREFPDIPGTSSSASHILSAQATMTDKKLMPPPPTKEQSRHPQSVHNRRNQPAQHQRDQGTLKVPSLSRQHRHISSYRPPKISPSQQKSPVSSPSSPSSSTTSFRASQLVVGIQGLRPPVEGSGAGIMGSPVLQEDSKDFETLPSPLGASLPTDPQELMELLRTVPRGLLQSAMESSEDKEEEEPVKRGSRSNHECKLCSKPFKRACDLRKHMKRHDRPYGCTVYRCGKKFGSKNDWKRHETGQHNQNDEWQCDMGCNFVSTTRELFESHLQSFHQLKSNVMIMEKLDKNRRIKQVRHQYWCGFCEEWIKVSSSSEGGYSDQRFNHIDAHFVGRGMRKMCIEDWAFTEENMNPDFRKTSANRKRKFARQTSERPVKQTHT